MKPFFVSIPHSGETVPVEATWLQDLPEPILMCDVDRFVDFLYQPALKEVGLPVVVTKWHRYVVDLNRIPSDIDQDSVVGSANPSGKFPMGLHWVQTTLGYRLMAKPISQALHDQLVQNYFAPFHTEVRGQYAKFFKTAKNVYHIDAHSMPSMGTSMHRDPGQRRPEIVVSDCEGKSCESRFRDLVMASYKKAGFEVALNWPYKGGRVTETYGHPEKGQHAIQVEMNRDLYMNEETKKLKPELAAKVQERLKIALKAVYEGL